MTTYLRRPTPVQAWTFEGQPQKEWPEFITTYQVMTTYGVQSPTMNPVQAVNIPVRGGPTALALKGDTLVLENGVLTAYKQDAFERQFVAQDAPAVAEEQPVPTADETATKPAPSKTAKAVEPAE